MSKAQTNAKDPIGDALQAVTHPAGGAAKKEAAKTIPEKIAEVASAAAAPVVAAIKRIVRHLSIQRLQLRGYLHNSWDATVERGTTLEDVLVPEFWLHVARQLKPQDDITVICEDGTWKAYLTVVASDVQWARMFLERHYDLTKSYENMPKTQEEEFEVTWNVIGKYAIIKKSLRGQPPLKDGFQTKLEAYQWLDGHLKSLNS